MRDVSWNGQTWDAQVTATASNHGLRAHFEPSPDEVVSTDSGGSYYTGAIEVANPNIEAISVSIDIGDRQVVVLSVPPGEYRTLSAIAVRPWSEVYRFLDIGATTDKSFLIRNPTIIHGDYGTITTYNGDSPHWLWDGAARESTSSGPLP